MQTKHSTQAVAIRLKPGMDLLQEINKEVEKNQWEAAWIQTAVGSLTRYNIRFANQPGGVSDSGHFEVVSLTGTLSTNGSHLHIAVSDSTGRTLGGHLLEGNIIYTTLELVIGVSDQYRFTRAKDGTTPWKELQIEEKKP